MKQDFRVVKTTRRIQMALIKMLLHKPFEKVTVTDLIKIAKISRRSFYVHYTDKYDLLTKMEQQIIQEIHSSLAEDHQQLKPVTNFKDPQLFKNTEATFQRILSVINQHRQSLAVLLSKNGDYQFKSKIYKLITDEISHRLSDYGAEINTGIPSDYAQAIFVGSLMDLMTIWIQKKNPEPIPQFAALLTKSRMIAPLELLKFN